MSMIDSSDPVEWSHPQKIWKDADCPQCGYGGGHHVTVFCEKQIGRRCLTCRATWPIDVGEVKERDEGNNDKRIVKTDKELEQIAVDLHAGKIFSDRHCKNQEELRMAFPILMLADEEMIKAMKEDEVEFLYEYLDQASPRTVNGLPIFLSVKTLTKKETARMFEFYKEIEKL